MKELQEKIYNISNTFLPLHMFYNDIRDIDGEIIDKQSAFKDLEKIANFIIDLQNKNSILEKALELTCEILAENDKAYKPKFKQRTKEKYFKLLIEQAKESLK